MHNDTSRPYVRLFEDGAERLRTLSGGVGVTGLTVGDVDANPHNATGLQVSMATDEKIVLSGSNNPYIRFQEVTTDRAYIRWLADSDALTFVNTQSDNFDFLPHDTTGAVNIRLRGNDLDTWGSVYADDNSNTGRIGFLDDDQSWAYRITSDSIHEWMINGGVEMSLSTSTLDMKGNTITEVEDIGLRDKLYHDGDTDTYLGFGTDTITLATGGSSEVTINTTGVRLGDTGNGYFQPVSGNYGSIQIDGGAHGGWEGYSIGARVVFMHDNSNTTGLYNDVDNEWLIRAVLNGASFLYDNGVAKFQTTTSGAQVNGNLAVTGTVDGRDVATDGTKLDTIATNANVGLPLSGGNMTGSINLNNYGLTGCNSITAINDTNTYLDFHAADQFRVVTGGTERFEVNNSLVTSAVTIQAPKFQENSTYYADFGNTGDSIRVAGDIVAYYSSDKRLKTNIKPIENATDKVTKLGGYTFNWSEEAEDKDTEKTEVGLIAQEVQEVMPELVHEKDNGYLAVDYPKMVALLVESIKELKEEINELKRDI